MRKNTIAAALCAALLFSGCSDTKEYDPVKIEINNSSATTTTTATTTSATAASTTTAATTAPYEETAEPVQTTATQATTVPTDIDNQPTEEAADTEDAANTMCSCYIPYGDHYLSESEKDFIPHSLFVGDSICSGFEVYGILDPDLVITTKSVGARNLLDFKHMYKGKERELEDIFKAAKPEYIFLSMGMNDINMTGPETFCDNYSRIIDLALEHTDAQVYYCAITPVDSDFTSNERIKYFNESMYSYIGEHYPERVHTVDFGKLLVCADGEVLCDQIAGGDGIHLAPYAYHIALWEIRNVLDQNAQPAEQTTEQATEQTTER